jgi:hypothetical protein
MAVFNFLSFPRAFDINRCYFAEKCDMETVPKEANFALIISLSGAKRVFHFAVDKILPLNQILLTGAMRAIWWEFRERWVGMQRWRADKTDSACVLLRR